MTANQINYAKHLEGVRHSIAEEAETKRSNLVRERETERSNRQFELIGVMNAQAAQANASAALANASTNAYNAATRHDEQWASQRNYERQNYWSQVAAAETHRHNLAMEAANTRNSRANAFNSGVNMFNAVTNSFSKVGEAANAIGRFIIG